VAARAAAPIHMNFELRMSELACGIIAIRVSALNVALDATTRRACMIAIKSRW
jgi:hypothetical protein